MRLRRSVVICGSVLSSIALVVVMLATPSTGATMRHASTPGVSRHQIVLGATTPLTGPAAPGYDEIAPATNAVFRYINAHGGIYGRNIKYDILNDQYDPTLTVQMTRQLVEVDHEFAEVGALGTPTQLAVEGYLKDEHIPDAFIESGCACWNDSHDPYVFGWQPDYVVEGKILGHYVERHLDGRKVGYLYQDDEFGIDGVRGLDAEIRHSAVVSRQTYQATTAGLAAGLGSQIAAIKASGAKIVVLYTIPAATALALLAAAELNYHPLIVISSVGSDPPTVGGLLSSFSKGKAGEALLNGVISNAYLPLESDATNPWVILAKSILHKYDKGYHWDGNSEYGVSLGMSAVEMLRAAGKNLTRSSFMKALERDGHDIAAANLVPFDFSKTDHYGMSGSELVTIHNGSIKAISPLYVTTNKGKIYPYSGAAPKIPALFKQH
ncbi:MAG: ABC transporter substrate-binding protein [Acidimicrobiales bacterium]